MRRICGLALVALMMLACAAPPAPVVDRSDGPGMRLQADGQYRVRRGDTLYTIAFRFGLDHREVAAWNGIGPPYTIYPDQVLRMTPPPRQLAYAKPAQPAPAPAPRPASRQPETPPTQPAPVQAAPKPRPETVQNGDPDWQWPASGRILRRFVANDPARNGLDIAGEVGQDIRSAAAGTVVYSGNGLIGYGELIIVKHNERFLSAYAHNRVRLVEEGERVSAGQKIAEMGRNDRNEALLHFEIRASGRPQDPQQYLPAR